MLPKLQQSSLAQSLRRDNPATLIQSRYLLMQLRISWKTLLAELIINPINLGRISMPQRILIPPLEISQVSTCLRKKYKRKDMNQINSSKCLDLSINMKEWEGQEEEHLLLYKKSNNFIPHLQRVELSKKEMCLHPNLGVTTIEEICL